MGALDPAKILVILVVALIVLGPERLPKVAREAGGVWRELTKIREQVVAEIRDAIPDDLPRPSNLTQHLPLPAKGAVSGFVSGLMTPETNTAAVPSSTGEDAASDNSDPEASITHTARPVQLPPDNDRRSLVVVHPALGEFAFIPDDPNMN